MEVYLKISNHFAKKMTNYWINESTYDKLKLMKTIITTLITTFILTILSSILFFWPLTVFAYRLPLAKPAPMPNKKGIINSFQPDLSIAGAPLASKEQCVKHLLSVNPLPLITVSPQELVEIFYEEGLREGIRPDVAFAQSLHETGFFSYGGDVIALQNNYAGLGTTGGGTRGLTFPEARIGIRAQIQHLKAYSSFVLPALPIVDPRYELVKKATFFGNAKTWQSLNGRWAVPGKTYGQKILAIHQDIIKTK
ncbi:MAG TPA: glucosaminidase domain-containing protein [Methylomusa anaerophila]|uniref:Mannosyl-glycoprotein endo-beta-N-acetylglucosaminidase n=1 Tax=Methylomusa anaerophila TaxID=1930071 RepID=A0A348ALR1_9FIRM|nr:glucosaminidase domain-containing protein [Methylomusa anaerophila]BBB92009.1 mannosyl-glycoprotein endo-beta-N-acetylglucosaminidase [Methylomusa anaerophila]HML87979.1 glucosaminidase domain-containing protein [Methylomusa anaerophila]